MSRQHARPRLGRMPTVEDARRYIRTLSRWVGPGFHPDTDFHEYVRADSGERSFAPDEADSLNAEMRRAIEALDAAGIDPCGVALPVQRGALGKMAMG